MNIRHFKQGDIITRIEPAKSTGYILTKEGYYVERAGDRGYMGEKILFKDVANGMIYFQVKERRSIFLENDPETLKSIPLDLYENGWEKWIDPKKITGIVFSEEEIQKQIQNALENENYELAEKLKKQSKKWKK